MDRRGVPAIAARAKAEGGEVQWGDETALVNTDVRGRRYAPPKSRNRQNGSSPTSKIHESSTPHRHFIVPDQ